MRDKRRALSAAERLRASHLLCARLAKHPYYIQARTVGIYYPNDGEINVTLLLYKDRVRKFYLPVLPPKGQRRLRFARYQLNSNLILDRYGIPEPMGSAEVRAERLDLLLVPLVAFDLKGSRIGMGGGFYDASLEFLKKGRIRPTRVLGAAYQFQLVDGITEDSWDVPLHGVISERQFFPGSGA